MKKNVFLSKGEFRVVTLILAVIAFISFFNYQAALKRGRDNERENDLSDLAKLLEVYKTANAVYPLSLSLLPNAPKDPGTPQGYAYLYLTDGKFYQLYASLEGGPSEAQFMPTVAALKLKCGQYLCNFGVTAGKTPLDKSLSEYENELNAKVIKK